ncbi:MAG TPA: hypothetical protein VGP96_14655, partial [Candidatus Dormibacteraeota bacterium]|nr:hypothetical protein [Candidatus Dormibacteraeota bacterium]
WANAAGGTLWVGVLLGVGLLVGDHLDRATGLLSTMGVVVLGGGGLVVLTAVGRARRRERRARRPDRPAPREGSPVPTAR